MLLTPRPARFSPFALSCSSYADKTSFSLYFTLLFVVPSHSCAVLMDVFLCWPPALNLSHCFLTRAEDSTTSRARVCGSTFVYGNIRYFNQYSVEIGQIKEMDHPISEDTKETHVSFILVFPQCRCSIREQNHMKHLVLFIFLSPCTRVLHSLFFPVVFRHRCLLPCLQTLCQASARQPYLALTRACTHVTWAGA